MDEHEKGAPAGAPELETLNHRTVACPTHAVKVGPYRVHPVAALFPMMEERDFNSLVEDIQAHGQLEPIIVDGDVLIDGRNRLKACEELGIKPKVVQWSEIDAKLERKSGGYKADQANWIYAKNCTRRHLTPDQKAQVEAAFLEHVFSARAEDSKARSQFKAGNEESSKGGKAKAGVLPAHLKTGEPARDAKSEHSRSTAGRIAEATGVSRHKAEMAVKLHKLAKVDPEAKAQEEAVIAGKLKLKDTKAKVERAKKDEGESATAIDATPTSEWRPDELERRNAVMLGKTVVANCKRDTSLNAWAQQEGWAIKVDRSGPFGNPFILGKDGNRDEVCDKFRDSYMPLKTSFKKDDLRGKVLICHCYPERCHGNDLAKWADEEAQ